jgi:formate dehydrogenase major subunit
VPAGGMGIPIATGSDIAVDTSGNTATLDGHVRTWAEHDAVIGAAWMASGVFDVREKVITPGVVMITVGIRLRTKAGGRRSAGTWGPARSGGIAMDVVGWIGSWPVYRQLAQGDRLGLGAAVKSSRTQRLTPRVSTADAVVKSVCPYCAVGCGQQVYVQDEKVTQIEGDPDSPVSRGRLCPKGSASLQLTTGDAREYQVRYRRPHGTEWEDLDLDTAMDMIADRVIAARRAGWQDQVDGAPTRRTLGFASLGGATLDNEENYLIKKLFTSLGAIQIENQARI